MTFRRRRLRAGDLPPVPNFRYFVDDREVDASEWAYECFLMQMLYGNTFVMRSSSPPGFPGEVVVRCIDPRRVHVATDGWKVQT